MVDEPATGEPTGAAELEALPETPLSSCLVRVIWLFGGIAGLLLLLVPIVMNDGGWLSFASVAYWVVLLLIVVARYVDVRCFAGTMPNTRPATLGDAHRFNAVIVISASAAWVLAHAA